MATNQESLAELSWAIEMSQGQFTPIIAHCNYAGLREKLGQQLREICPLNIIDITLEPSHTQLYSIITKIQSEIQSEVKGRIPGIQVFGLDSVKDIDRFLQEINPVREEFRKNCPFAVVLWASDRILQRFIRVISDFETWTTRIEFSLSDAELLEEIRQKAETLFATVLEIGDAEFIPNQIILGPQYLLELEAAVRDLKGDRQQLTPELSASLKFVRGRDAYIKDQIDNARNYYQESLAFWSDSNHQQRQGILLFHLGLCSQRQAELNPKEKQRYLQTALSEYRQSINIFERANSPDLVAKFIGQIGDILRRLEDWDNLANIAEKSQQLHTQYGSPVQLARDYGFLAKVALNRQKFTEAKELAERAISILANTPNNSVNPADMVELSQKNSTSQLTASYLLLLGQSWRGMGQIKTAIKTLETAKQTNPEYNPQIYLNILEELHSIYFDRKEYLTAFNLKQECRSIQQQFRLTAFIGAGRLQSQRYTKAVQMTTENREAVAEEIVASGREEDLQQLWQKLASTYSKLIVVHGQSGVGKSSLVNAGLIPSLKLKSIGTKDCLPVTLRVYANWQEELGKQLANALADRQIILPECTTTLANVLEQLKANDNHNLLTVLIFDQFEEFFFVCPEIAQQQEFFTFLADCLNLSGVKVILSLRTDYLHYLLIGNQLPSLDMISNDILCDILCKNVLYAIGNFSAASAAGIITRLTQRSQFQLEPELITEMVKDLAGQQDEIYPSVRPIELQVVGAQMQAENITTLAEYRERGPKDKLVQRYLEAVVKDCGEDNKPMAELVLYFLTDKDSHRPLKTLTELILDLKTIFAELNGLNGRLGGTQASVDQLVQQVKLILDIFVKSGLVFEVSDTPKNRYQLVHDYLVDLIHRQKIADSVAELKREREKRKQAEAKLTRTLQQQLRMAIAGGLVMVVLAGIAVFFGWKIWEQKREISDRNDKLGEQKENLEQEKKKLKQEINKSIKTSALLASELAKSNSVEALTIAIEVMERSNKEFNQDPAMMESVKSSLTEVMSVAYDRNLLEGHNSEVLAVAIAPDGEKIVSGSADGTIQMQNLDPENNTENNTENNALVKPTKRQGSIRLLAITPDGEKIVSSSEDNQIVIRDIKGNQLANFPKHEPKHKTEVRSLAITPDGSKIVSGSRDGMIRVWDIKSEKLEKFKGHKYPVSSVAITPDGSKIVSGSWDNKIRLWDFQGNELLVLKGHENVVSSLAITPDGTKIVSGSWDNKIRLWDFQGNELLVLKGHENVVSSLAITPDGSKIVSGSANGTIRLWPGSWKSWLEAGCERLRLDPAFVRAEASSDEKASGAANVCQEQVWNNAQIAEFYIQQGFAIAQLTGNSDEKFDDAKEKFEQARQWDEKFCEKFYASSDFNSEEKKLVTKFLSAEGEQLAKEGKLPEAIEKLSEAIGKFEQAQNMNHSLELDPEVKELVVKFLFDEGDKLAKEGKLSEAIDKFDLAQNLNPGLPYFDSEREAHRLFASSLFESGEQLAKEGKRSEAIDKFEQAQEQAPWLFYFDSEAKTFELAPNN